MLNTVHLSSFKPPEGAGGEVSAGNDTTNAKHNIPLSSKPPEGAGRFFSRPFGGLLYPKLLYLTRPLDRGIVKLRYVTSDIGEEHSPLGLPAL